VLNRIPGVGRNAGVGGIGFSRFRRLRRRFAIRGSYGRCLRRWVRSGASPAALRFESRVVGFDDVHPGHGTNPTFDILALSPTLCTSMRMRHAFVSDWLPAYVVFTATATKTWALSS
jgi:hypothetical protein